MLTYIQVHLQYTLPALLLLYLILHPFLGRREKQKLLLLSIISLLYTYPWDSYIIHSSAWTYRSDAVIGTASGIPFEEIAFFIITSLITTLFTILMTRWSLIVLHFHHEDSKRSADLWRWIPSLLLFLIAALVWSITSPG